MDNPDLLSEKSLKRFLNTAIFGRKFHLLDETDSTNRICFELACNGEIHGAAVAAKSQNSGRGRFDRKWASPAGGLWFSLLIRPRRPRNPSPFTVLCGSAVAGAITEASGIPCDFHWPNDIYTDGKKLGGILTATRFTGQILDFIIAGIGINGNYPAQVLGGDLAVPGTTLMDLTGGPFNLNLLLAVILKNLEESWQIFENEGPAPLMAEARKRCITLGRRIMVMESESRSFEGTAEDLTDEGHLSVITEKGERVILNNAHRIRLLQDYSKIKKSCLLPFAFFENGFL